ncbi:membrane-spanning 4-domains subfamily A member 12-like [Onychostoma macrolepis]|uniref:membrane-spanning 4-domains subfamily A member 12-like n=1 Tax=Onychostoma macrolepis TaxID=369639 RepID=UPI00272C6A15|nr:membrane-spanning 4-domains subfamily A member 12-like [Onychostoma macrolepis]XP_058646232.1 membrane-spanning 4-domains subfamily A member 12-like [Onychostoma macrolepis]
MESSKVISTDKATVIIQINPRVAQDAVISEDGQKTGGAYHNTALAEFVRAQPKALGTVQIMTGVMIFLFGIVHTRYRYDDVISVITGITYWGSLIYISAGSLSVSAQNKLHPCVVKAALIMNVISAITAAAAIVLMSIEMGFLTGYNRSGFINYNSYDTTCSLMDLPAKPPATTLQW